LFGRTYIHEDDFSMMTLNKFTERNRMAHENLTPILLLTTTSGTLT
jgi:hypothetical protein